MKPEDVPEELVDAFLSARVGKVTDATKQAAREILAAVLPAHERQVRERVAAEIEVRRCVDVALDVCARCSCRSEDARIARGES